ncbi:hypothetical protein V1L65_22540 [Paenibacillus sp. IITD108]
MVVREEIICGHKLVGEINEDNSWFVATLLMTAPDGTVDPFYRTAPDYQTALNWIDDSLEELRKLKS